MAIDYIVRAANCFKKLTVDTGSPSSFINKRTADRLLGNKATKATYCPASQMKNYVKHIDYNNKQINILGELTVRVTSAGWVVPAAKFLVVEKARCLLGLDWQESVGIKTTQVYNPNAKENDEQDSPPTVASTESQNTDDWVSEKWKDYFSSKYAEVFNRQGRSKSHVVTTNFYSPLIPIQEKGRRVPVHILNRVEKEIDKLMASNQIEKL